MLTFGLATTLLDEKQIIYKGTNYRTISGIWKTSFSFIYCFEFGVSVLMAMIFFGFGFLVAKMNRTISSSDFLKLFFQTIF